MEKQKEQVKQEIREITYTLDNVGWKLKALAGLFWTEEAGRHIELDADRANGFYMLLDQLADEIQNNAERITEVTA